MRLSTLFQSVFLSFHWQNWPYILFILHLKYPESLNIYSNVMKLADSV